MQGITQSKKHLSGCFFDIFELVFFVLLCHVGK